LFLVGAITDEAAGPSAGFQSVRTTPTRAAQISTSFDSLTSEAFETGQKMSEMANYANSGIASLMDGHTFNNSEMALFHECMLWCAQKVLDTADIVREAIFQHQRIAETRSCKKALDYRVLTRTA
jgi:hypothetical protein